MSIFHYVPVHDIKAILKLINDRRKKEKYATFTYWFFETTEIRNHTKTNNANTTHSGRDTLKKGKNSTKRKLPKINSSESIKESPNKRRKITNSHKPHNSTILILSFSDSSNNSLYSIFTTSKSFISSFISSKIF